MDTFFLYLAIGLYFAAMLAIGLYASRQNDDLDDYMLGGRRMHPAVAALSAGAADMSGWLMMGLPGAIYAGGLVEAWIAVGLTAGAWVNWRLVAPRLRAYTEVAGNAITIPSFLENRFEDRTRVLRIVGGLIILVFFAFYVSSGMVAGGRFFESSIATRLDGAYLWGMLLVASITVVYTLFGGFLGASLTDVAQGLLMFLALLAVPVIVVLQLGGWGAVVDSVRVVDTAQGVDHFSLFTGMTGVGVLSALGWGLGYFGQPHIITRFMALRSPRDAAYGRRVGITWMALCCIGAIMTAVVGVAFFQANPDRQLENPETVYLVLSSILFHPFVGGLVLAAVLAAIMSTVSSQLIVSSSALVEDIVKVFGVDLSARAGLWWGRAGVLVVSVVAILMAVSPSATILDLVGFAWAGFGAAFGPLIVLALFWRRYTAWGAMASMVSGAAMVFLWANVIDPALGWGLYELVPAFLIALVLGVVVSLAAPDRGARAERIQADFTVMEAHAR